MGNRNRSPQFDQWKRRADMEVSELREFVRRELDDAVRSEGLVRTLGLAVERRVQDITNELGRALMHEVFELADTHAPEVRIGGEAWGCRRVQPGTYETTFGEVSLARSTYQRAGRGRVSVPLELRLGIVERRYTPLVARIANRSMASMPTGEAEALLEEVGVCKVSRSTLHRLPQAMLARVAPVLEGIEQSVRAQDAIPEDACTVQVALDGVMVPMDGEDAQARGRKTETPAPARHEAKYSVRGEPPVAAQQAEEPTESDDATSAPAKDTDGLAWREAAVGTVSFWDKDGEMLKTIYLGQMPSFRKANLSQRLEREFAAVMQSRPDLQVVLASDGAPTQWDTLRAMGKRVMGETPWIELLDFFHCASRVGTAAKAIWATSEEATVTGEHWKTVLRERERGAALVLKSLEHQRSIANESTAAVLTKAMNYIARNNKEKRLNYAAAKKAHLPIGTGVTEAAAKTLVSVRMKRSGARYTMHGGQTILTLRAALLSERFDAFSSEIEATYMSQVAA